ncbi:1241_t:CDS:2 [Dentiscutata heterogama]|uniref:1241_t:CDS:1 n=1 Tax=Dentiscutata heterogama TaxID=1316150 RepID=A0ACA9KW04_9GLOM|nr:1241_t:CDS:2 [Dentiscutata heterogama]
MDTNKYYHNQEQQQNKSLDLRYVSMKPDQDGGNPTQGGDNSNPGDSNINPKSSNLTQGMLI